MFHVSELSALLLVILHAFSTSLWVKVEFHPNGIATAAILEKKQNMWFPGISQFDP